MKNWLDSSARVKSFIEQSPRVKGFIEGSPRIKGILNGEIKVRDALKSLFVSVELKQDSGTTIFRNGNMDHPMLSGKGLYTRTTLWDLYGSRLISTGMAGIFAYWLNTDNHTHMHDRIKEASRQIMPVDEPFRCTEPSIPSLSAQYRDLRDFDTMPSPLNAPIAWRSYVAGHYRAALVIRNEMYQRCLEWDKHRPALSANDYHRYPVAESRFADSVSALIHRVGMRGLLQTGASVQSIEQRALASNRYALVLSEYARAAIVRQQVEAALRNLGRTELPGTEETNGISPLIVGTPNAYWTGRFAQHLPESYLNRTAGDSVSHWLLPESISRYSPHRLTDEIHRQLDLGHVETNHEHVDSLADLDLGGVSVAREGQSYPFLNRVDVNRLRRLSAERNQ